MPLKGIELREGFITICTILLLFPVMALATPETRDIEIRKMAIMIHPTGWSAALGPDGKVDPEYRRTLEELRGGVYYADSEFHAYLDRERLVNQCQRAFIAKMAPNEAMVIFPGGGEAMQEMISFCEEKLGRRCIVVKSPVP